MPSNHLTAEREISAMAWIENEFGHVLMVRQSQGNLQWALPGGKVRANEDVLSALKREVREETGLGIAAFELAAIYDRVPRKSVAILFRVRLKLGEPSIVRPKEIVKISFKARIPSKASPSAKYFWAKRHTFK